MKNLEQLKTPEIIERLAKKFSSPQYGFITQFKNGTGYASDRTADAIAMSLWPSRGLHIYGFEVKSSRNDWLTEMKNPEKADAIARYCHYWYLVVGNKNIVKDDELPKTWGLIVPFGNGLKIEKEAILNDKALAFNDLMIAGLFRNISDHCVPKELVEIQIDNRVNSTLENWKVQVEDSRREIKELKDIINDFNLKTDLQISQWDKEGNKELIEAVKIALEGNDKIEKIKVKLNEMKNVGDRIGKFIKDEIQSYQI